MSKAQAAADRVEAFLREHVEKSAAPDVVVVEYGLDEELVTIDVADLVALIESAHWLALAGTGQLHREYAATTEDQTLVGRHMRPEELSEVQRNVNGWNAASRADEAFVAQRLVSDWERRP